MKLLTLHEPYATLMALRLKRIETRGWKELYRGPVAIHAAAGGLTLGKLEGAVYHKDFFAALDGNLPLFREWNARPHPKPNIRRAGVFPFGAIVAVGNLVDCLLTEANVCLPGVFDDYPKLDTVEERAFGNYEPGRFGLVFEDVYRLPAPVPFKSRQGKLLDLDAETERLVLRQMV